jgi:hypothetical protein
MINNLALFVLYLTAEFARCVNSKAISAADGKAVAFHLVPRGVGSTPNLYLRAPGAFFSLTSRLWNSRGRVKAPGFYGGVCA